MRSALQGMSKKREQKRREAAGSGPARAESPSTATPASVRKVNRAILLNLIRTHQPVSRIQLSALTGIYRSNVSFIVEELLREGLVREERGRPSGRGRVPTFLSLNPDGRRVVGVSIRAAETVAALADLTGEVLGRVRFRTPKTAQSWLGNFRRCLERLRGESARQAPGIQHICISVPGMVDQASGEILWVNALPGYSGSRLREMVQEASGVEATIANDCHLATTCERWMGGIEADLRNMVFLEVGDVGVGAGMVVNGELCTGYNSTFAAEFGHMVVDPSGPRCNCGRRGCWELFVCDRATWARYDSASEYTTGRFEELIGLARSGDKRAVKAFQTTARQLGLGISNITMVLNPEVVILAGKVTEVWGIVSPLIEEALRVLPGKPQLRPARMPAEDLFLHGAIRQALSGLFARPQLG
jgi:predicted NBD/HSP70 family sugar kinase